MGGVGGLGMGMQGPGIISHGHDHVKGEKRKEAKKAKKEKKSKKGKIKEGKKIEKGKER